MITKLYKNLCVASLGAILSAALAFGQITINDGEILTKDITEITEQHKPKT